MHGHYILRASTSTDMQRSKKHHAWSKVWPRQIKIAVKPGDGLVWNRLESTKKMPQFHLMTNDITEFTMVKMLHGLILTTEIDEKR